ncbi:MAG: hypothetical protein ZNDK_0663 [Candidatus Desulfovibrio kirbyi]|uniref:Helicase HerA central domain-containing protein n=1 Tax=Candidatus Desulfovibrio kirbyi TaxID=2696086 RepID=A0A6L2R614_9BACT|nr:MAG: hypothetical protein ZNDK_0663 [Candidatus Desulfovibrio kirbyi]
MKTLEINKEFPRGLLRPELFLGVASSISARSIGVNLSEAGRPSGSHYSGSRYGRGEVGEFVLVEGQQCLLLGRISEVRLREQERRSIKPGLAGGKNLDAIGQIQLLGSVALDELRVTPGVETYPRLGDRIYAAPHRFISLLPLLMEKKETESQVSLDIGFVDSVSDSKVSVKPEKLFGRHCAILGSTGGGKSWTTARIVEECIQHKSKIILLDATGEYRDFHGQYIENCHLGSPVRTANVSQVCSLPPTSFIESDFIALFEPSGKVQGPKLKSAIESLRLAKICTDNSIENGGIVIENGVLVKEGKEKLPIQRALVKYAETIQDPSAPFDVKLLPRQIVAECVNDYGDQKWKGKNEQEIGWCAALIARINAVFKSHVLKCVFSANGMPPITQKFDSFLAYDKRLFRICMSGIGYEFKAREIIANVIGRYLLNRARNGDFHEKPTIVIVDEAHNFLGRHIGAEDYIAKLDAFEIIAKEGRKYGLSICLATQRPRDITEGVLSQMGTMIVHRLTNDKDREVVERACGEIDKAASAFLPNLRPGQAAIIGVDFPIPLTVQIEKPNTRPKSDGPDYQTYWKLQKAAVQRTLRSH